MLYSFSLGEWSLLAVASLLIGLSKTGIPGIGILAIALFATVLPARESSGFVLPLLICADAVAVCVYARQADWRHLARLAPWAVLGVLVGYWAIDRLNAQQTARVIGAILVGLVVVQVVREYRRSKSAAEEETIPDSAVFSGSMGILAGFTTMVANAAGPIMNLYLLAMRLPKLRFMGTAAWYFFLLNSFKVPFSIGLGLMTRDSLTAGFQLAPFVVAGALGGRLVISHIPQRAFEWVALALAAAAGVKLLLPG